MLQTKKRLNNTIEPLVYKLVYQLPLAPPPPLLPPPKPPNPPPPPPKPPPPKPPPPLLPPPQPPLNKNGIHQPLNPLRLIMPPRGPPPRRPTIKNTTTKIMMNVN